MSKIKTPETWKHYGEWCPTASLRWSKHGKLEQIWKRVFEECYKGGVVLGGGGFEKEWREVPYDEKAQP